MSRKRLIESKSKISKPFTLNLNGCMLEHHFLKGDPNCTWNVSFSQPIWKHMETMWLTNTCQVSCPTSLNKKAVLQQTITLIKPNLKNNRPGGDAKKKTSTIFFPSPFCGGYRFLFITFPHIVASVFPLSTSWKPPVAPISRFYRQPCALEKPGA